MSIDVTSTEVRNPYELAALLGQLPPTAEQAEIIAAPLAPLLVVAGAGSGKTTTMADRVVWLVANGHVLPEEILGVTFTRKAAGELSSRIRRQLGKLAELAHSGALDLAPAAQDALDPKVSTYHSYASGIVADYGLRMGIERDAVVLGSAQSWQLASTIVETYEGKYDHFTAAKSSLVRAVMSLAGECSEHLAEPADVHELLDDLVAQLESLPYIEGKSKPSTAAVTTLLNVLRTRGSVAGMVERYSQAKRDRNALDFGDLVALAARIAQNVPQASELERARYKVVLLDEFQDTSHAQLTLFARLFGGGHPVTAVGDPHQSIYGFRGASAGQLFAFPDTFRTTEGTPAAAAELTTAWRNDERILSAANVMSAELNTAERLRHPDSPVRVSPLQARPGAGRGTVQLARFATAVEEADAVVNAIVAQRSEAADGPRSIAVLCRRRAQFALLQPGLQARGIPYEVVGLGGLLSTPEIVDLVAELRVIADPGRSDALMRLLTGARWRIGTADLMAFAAWARYLARRRDRASRQGRMFDPENCARPEENREDAEAAGAVSMEADLVDASSLIEALDYLGPDYWPEGLGRELTPEARQRLLRLRDELRRLRSFAGDELGSLLGEVERTMLLDIELAAKPGTSIVASRRNLDAFAGAAADFLQAAERVDLQAFLSWLEAAQEQENGLGLGEVEVNPQAVQLLTVHAAKGLEWDAVFIPGLNAGSFPTAQADRWTSGASSLPWPLRGDSQDLPAWDVDAADQRGWLESEKNFTAEVRLHVEEEERRLAYVAFTRARKYLWCSAAAWTAGRSTQAQPSPFLAELLPLADVGKAELLQWPADDALPVRNPLTAERESAPWPYDPLEGPEIKGRSGVRSPAGRRQPLEAGAYLIRSLRAAGIADDGGDAALAASPRWGREARSLLALRDVESADSAVELPMHISASMLVDLGDDPAAVTRQLRRPVPQRPGMAARAGTAFHAWVEEFYGTTGQLDLDEAPSADYFVDQGFGLDALQETFRGSEWARRMPVEIEVPIETIVDGVVVRGRIDAVFRDPDGSWDLIDWKTGAVPAKGKLSIRSVQLAAYRLAWARLKNIPLESVRAAFYYVAQDRLIRPADLAGEDELEQIIRSATSAP